VCVREREREGEREREREEEERESRDENSLVSAIYICGESISLRPEHEPNSFSSLMRSMNTDPATSLNATPMRTNSSRFFAEKEREER
jgi:hypothetical protein